ncbi:hypothetical protein GCM10009127_15220 [Alteraurantiacibacter aestuarii]|uniref:Uncharacterized protein n=1 Tax=Alteraurantiacibacter aestuarii TaxID=650004 RepID=A0A844ZHC5_9SPHN|nr:hypothetical protein [Alteraurantiacibacter aestuarii]MXO87891.1 hypothetical protein [Alteraurantiacibacter aestuarii]
MPKRRIIHSDNKLIDSMAEFPTPSQGSTSGGEVNRLVGARAEMNRVIDPDDRERAIGSDNPAEDALKGRKTSTKIQSDRTRR